MKGKAARARVRQARAEVADAERALAALTQSWRERLARHSAWLLIGGGALGGFALARVAPRHWSRAGAALFGGGAWLARLPLAPVILGALLSRAPPPAPVSQVRAGVAEGAPSP